MDAPDQVALTGTLADGALASLHYHGGPSKGPHFVWEINGSEGDLVLSAERGYANIADLELRSARGKHPLELLPIPPHYRRVRAELSGPAVNVASLYATSARDLAQGSSEAPDFAAALRRHRLLDAVERADASGERQVQ